MTGKLRPFYAVLEPIVAEISCLYGGPNSVNMLDSTLADPFSPEHPVRAYLRTLSFELHTLIIPEDLNSCRKPN